MSDYSTIKDRKSPLKGSRPSVPHGTNFLSFCDPLHRYQITRVTFPFIGGVKYTGVGKIGNFRRISPFISETLPDRPMVTMER